MMVRWAKQQARASDGANGGLAMASNLCLGFKEVDVQVIKSEKWCVDIL